MKFPYFFMGFAIPLWLSSATLFVSVHDKPSIYSRGRGEAQHVWEYFMVKPQNIRLPPFKVQYYTEGWLKLATIHVHS